MAFQKITKARPNKRATYHASLNLNVIRFTMNGIDTLDRFSIKFQGSDKVDLFYDSETHRIGIKKTPNGNFAVAKTPKQEQFFIRSLQLIHLNKIKRVYLIEKSDGARDDFDFILVPCE